MTKLGWKSGVIARYNFAAETAAATEERLSTLNSEPSTAPAPGAEDESAN